MSSFRSFFVLSSIYLIAPQLGAGYKLFSMKMRNIFFLISSWQGNRHWYYFRYNTLIKKVSPISRWKQSRRVILPSKFNLQINIFYSNICFFHKLTKNIKIFKITIYKNNCFKTNISSLSIFSTNLKVSPWKSVFKTDRWIYQWHQVIRSRRDIKCVLMADKQTMSRRSSSTEFPCTPDGYPSRRYVLKDCSSRTPNTPATSITCKSSSFVARRPWPFTFCAAPFRSLLPLPLSFLSHAGLSCVAIPARLTLYCK